jgi:hypothetical protein
LDAKAVASEDGLNDDSTSDVTVVMALLFGRVDDEEWAAGDPAVGAAAPRSRSGILTRRHWTVGDTERGVKVFLAKAQHFNVNDDDVCGYRNPLGALLWVPSPRMVPGENP